MEPIEKLIDAANRVEDGNFEEHVEYEGEEEFEKLCHSFNTMRDSLAAGVDRAEEYDKAKTEMIAGMSHDLRTPLTSIKGYIKGVKRRSCQYTTEAGAVFRHCLSEGMCHGCAATKTFGFFKVRDRKYADGAGGDRFWSIFTGDAG